MTLQINQWQFLLVFHSMCIFIVSNIQRHIYTSIVWYSKSGARVEVCMLCATRSTARLSLPRHTDRWTHKILVLNNKSSAAQVQKPSWPLQHCPLLLTLYGTHATVACHIHCSDRKMHRNCIWYNRLALPRLAMLLSQYCAKILFENKQINYYWRTKQHKENSTNDRIRNCKKQRSKFGKYSKNNHECSWILNDSAASNLQCNTTTWQ